MENSRPNLENIKIKINNSFKSLIIIFYKRFGHRLNLTRNKYLFNFIKVLALNFFRYNENTYLGKMNGHKCFLIPLI